MVRYNVARHNGTVQYGTVRYGAVLYDKNGMIWYGEYGEIPNCVKRCDTLR